MARLTMSLALILEAKAAAPQRAQPRFCGIVKRTGTACAVPARCRYSAATTARDASPSSATVSGTSPMAMARPVAEGSHHNEAALVGCKRSAAAVRYADDRNPRGPPARRRHSRRSRRPLRVTCYPDVAGAFGETEAAEIAMLIAICQMIDHGETAVRHRISAPAQPARMRAGPHPSL